MGVLEGFRVDTALLIVVIVISVLSVVVVGGWSVIVVTGKEGCDETLQEGV